MIEKTVDIPTPEGQMNAFIAHPDAPGPFPTVVIYMDFWGFREELFDIVRRVAAAGYYCILPNFYYRIGRVSHAFYDENGRMISFELLDEERRKKALAPLESLTNDMVVRDTGSLIRFLHAGEPVRRGSMGSIGYCMGGRHVLCVMGAYPDYFHAGASLHGTNLISEKADSPHRLADKFRGELYCGFAEVDEYAGPEVIQGLQDLARQNPQFSYMHEVHIGALHGYALPDRDIYHRQGANRDWELIFAMFYRRLPPYCETVARNG